MHRSPLLLCLWLFAAFAVARAGPDAGIKALMQWVSKAGGVVKAEVKTPANGVRGLFATEAIAEGEAILEIPETVIMNCGGLSGSIMAPILILLREVHTPCSRFKPYLDTLPRGSSVLNACTIPKEHVTLLQSPYWEKHVASYQDHVRDAWEGRLRKHMPHTFEDTLGDKKVTLDEVQGACALTVSRFFQNERDRVVLIPIADLANHQYQCPNYLDYGENGLIKLVAGADLNKGDEICYGYGSMRDDYAVFHYGFLPGEEDPPRLLGVDHPDFTEEVGVGKLGDELFDGTTEQLQAEADRLQAILSGLDETVQGGSASKKPDPGRDLILHLRERRGKALRAEIGRLRALLEEGGKQEL